MGTREENQRFHQKHKHQRLNIYISENVVERLGAEALKRRTTRPKLIESILNEHLPKTITFGS